MGKRGPVPLPSKIIALRSGEPGSGIPEGEPKPEEGYPDPTPAIESEAARQIWDELRAAVEPLDLMTKADSLLVEHLVLAELRFRDAQAYLETTGTLIRARDGNLVKNPAAQIARDNAALVLAFLRHVGGTPAARRELTAANAEPEADPLGEFDAGAGSVPKAV